MSSPMSPSMSPSISSSTLPSPPVSPASSAGSLSTLVSALNSPVTSSKSVMTESASDLRQRRQQVPLAIAIPRRMSSLIGPDTATAMTPEWPPYVPGEGGLRTPECDLSQTEIENDIMRFLAPYNIEKTECPSPRTLTRRPTIRRSSTSTSSRTSVESPRVGTSGRRSVSSHTRFVPDTPPPMMPLPAIPGTPKSLSASTSSPELGRGRASTDSAIPTKKSCISPKHVRAASQASVPVQRVEMDLSKDRRRSRAMSISAGAVASCTCTSSQTRSKIIAKFPLPPSPSPSSSFLVSPPSSHVNTPESRSIQQSSPKVEQMPLLRHARSRSNALSVNTNTPQGLISEGGLTSPMSERRPLRSPTVKAARPTSYIGRGSPQSVIANGERYRELLIERLKNSDTTRPPAQRRNLSAPIVISQEAMMSLKTGGRGGPGTNTLGVGRKSLEEDLRDIIEEAIAITAAKRSLALRMQEVRRQSELMATA